MDQMIDIRDLTERDLTALGVRNFAYVKPVLHQGQPAFAVHAADGTLVAITATRESAEGLIRNSDLEPLSVH